MPSLFDYAAPGRRQRERLQGLLSQPTVPPVTVEDPTLSLFGGDGGDHAISGNNGKAYSDMTPAQFNQEAQNRANAGFIERNLGPTVMGLGFPGISGFAVGRGMNALDKSLFDGTQAAHAANFAARGNPMPDELMAMSYGGDILGNAGLDAASLNAGAGEYGGLGGNRDGGYFKGGIVDEPLLPGDPPGPDDRIIGAKTGERVLTEEQYASLSKEARAEIDALMKKAKRK